MCNTPSTVVLTICALMTLFLIFKAIVWVIQDFRAGILREVEASIKKQVNEHDERSYVHGGIKGNIKALQEGLREQFHELEGRVDRRFYDLEVAAVPKVAPGSNKKKQ